MDTGKGAREEGRGDEVIEVVDRRTGGSGSRAWAFAAVAVVLILTVGFTVCKIAGVPVQIIDRVSRATERLFGHTVKIDTVISNTIGELTKESKLVVMTAEITVYVKRSSAKRVLWENLNLGTTTVELRVQGNRVQYVLPTAQITKETFRWDRSRGEVVIDIPCPVLDEELVEVQSDPSRIEVRKDVGWGRLESRSGDFLEGQIRAELRSLVIEQGKSELLLERARKDGEEAIRNLFIQFMKKEKVEVPVRTCIN